MARTNYTIRDRFGSKLGNQIAGDSTSAVDMFMCRTGELHSQREGLWAEPPVAPLAKGSRNG